jgi:hypothetical protein
LDLRLESQSKFNAETTHLFIFRSIFFYSAMKLSSIATIAGLVGTSLGHAIFQKVSVNGADQGQLKGVRAPDSDYPIQNVNDGDFACNKNIQHKDSTVINVPAGARVGAWWGHVIGGAQYANDPDNPIAASHKGKFPSVVHVVALYFQYLTREQDLSSFTSPRFPTPQRPAPLASNGSKSPSKVSITASGPSTT